MIEINKSHVHKAKDIAVKLLQIEDIQIIIGENDSIHQAAYNHRNRLIFVNIHWLSSIDHKNLYITIFHEVRHAYQIDLATQDDSFLVERGADMTLINAVHQWRIDLASYVSIYDNFHAYLNQSIEKDAQSFGIYSYRAIFENESNAT